MSYIIIPLIIVGIFLILLIYDVAWLKTYSKSGEVIGRVHFPERKVGDAIIFKDSYILFVSFLLHVEVITLSVTEKGFYDFKPGDTIPISYRRSRVLGSLVFESYPNMQKNKVYKIN